MSCIICDSTNLELMFKDIKDFEYETYKPVDYIICKDCKLISQHPLPRIDLLEKFYPENYRNYLPVKEDLFSFLKKLQFQKLSQKIAKHFHKDTKLLEIGFGNGQLLLALKEKGCENLYGCDFTDRVFPNLKNSGIKLAVSNLEDFPFNETKETFDGIIMNNVIEHFINPFEVLKKCRNNLTKGGKIILITPNSNSLDFSLFKKYWAGFHAPRHTFIFNDENIKSLSKKLGFSGVSIEGEIDPGQWSISIQNILQDNHITKTKLKNGMAWYTTPLGLFFLPITGLQNLCCKSTSMLCILYL